MTGAGDPALDVVRHPTARRIKLSFDPLSGRARLILPRRAALAPALAWAKGKAGWLEAQLAALPSPQPFAPGAIVNVADRALTIVWTPGSRRRVERIGDTLSLSGPIETLPRRVHAWLQREALALLTAETREFAARADVVVTAVAVGDARGRWGSCSGSGAIRYSWRLILAPGWVRRATVAHEIAHRLHMDHSPMFHAAVARLLEHDPAPARAWLKRHGAGLHWVGRSS